MKVAIATPLYPPDTASQATYVKEVATRLTKDHDVSLLTYGTIPEKISGVPITTLPKNTSRISRLLSFTKALHAHAKEHDILYIQNGTSTELPLIITSLLTNTPIIFHISDNKAHQRAQKNIFSKTIENLARARSQHTLSSLPNKKPEILPFEDMPTQELAKYEQSWGTHLETLTKLFHAKT